LTAALAGIDRCATVRCTTLIDHLEMGFGHAVGKTTARVAAGKGT
jgi:hypothetical protein